MSLRKFGALTAVLLVLAPPALATWWLELPVAHVNLDDQPPALQGSGPVAAKMVLDYLGAAAPLQDIFDFGRANNPLFEPTLEFDQDMTAATLDHFAPDPNYGFLVISEANYADALWALAAALCAANPDVAPYPQYSPALLPTYGNYENWQVVSGIYAEADPALDPTTAIYGVWLDNPRAYDRDPEGNPISTVTYYSGDPDAAGGFDEVWTPMAGGPLTGMYVAVVPVPEPSAALLLLVGAACRRRGRRQGGLSRA